MDKNEYQVKLQELTELVAAKNYKKAYEEVGQIDWRRVKSIRTLGMVADIYEINKDYENCMRILTLAHDRSPAGKNVLDRLVDMSIKTGDTAAAKRYYKEFIAAAPKNNARYVLKYKIAKADKRPLSEQIEILEEYKEKEFTEKWVYELAALYSRDGNKKKCVETCDDLILWFSEGKYVLKAINLKQRYETLTESQASYLESSKQAEVDSVNELSAGLAASVAASSKKPFIERIENAAEAAVGGDTVAAAPDTVKLDEVPVNSSEFIGLKPDLKSQLEESIKNVRSGVQAAPKVASKPLDYNIDELISETAGGFSVAAAASSVQGAAAGEEDDIVSRYADLPDKIDPKETSAVIPRIENADELSSEDVNKAPKPSFPSDWEIPDPEVSEEEKKSHTITLTNVGQNTVPISIEEVLKNETAEERRIRILNNAAPTKMSAEQRDVFTYFARIPGMDTQILETITGVYEYCAEHTSSHGNIAIAGPKGSGKSRLTYGLLVTMCRDMGLPAAKVARISGSEMNKKDPARVVGTMSGGFLCIDEAGKMTAETISRLCDAMEFRTDCMILIIEDTKSELRNLFRTYPDFASKFVRTISIPIFTNDELVTFARIYCQENGYQLDELAVLALYSIISSGQSQDNPMTISDVKAIVDKAITQSGFSAKKPAKKGAVKGKVPTVLYEKDFAF